MIRIPYDRDPREPRHDLPQEFETLARQLGEKKGEPRQVAARMRKARHDAGTDRIQAHRCHDGNGLGCGLGVRDHVAAERVDDVRPELCQLLRQHLQTLGPALGIAEFEDEIATFDVAGGAQRLAEGRHTGFRGRRAVEENAYSIGACGRLAVRVVHRGRQGQGGQGRRESDVPHQSWRHAATIEGGRRPVKRATAQGRRRSRAGTYTASRPVIRAPARV